MALRALGSDTFDLVLTDIRMPALSGFEVLRVARSCVPAPSVVMMTAYANVPDAVAAIQRGACDYVAKPVDADELALVVARALEQRRDASGDAGAPLPEGTELPAPGLDGVDVSLAFRTAIEAARNAASRRYLVKLMRSFQGNVTHAAARAGMTRESLHRVLRKYDLRSDLSTGPSKPEERATGTGRSKQHG
jgi:DNA-binding NtrC family response regulator